jgi:UDPglucose 6-dehydrogenase
MKVAVLGTGYVGLTTGVCLAYLGHSVVCMDPVVEKIESLRRGKIPIYEPGLEELLREVALHIRFTADAAEAIAEAEVVFICVGTPPQAKGAPDLSCLRAASERLGVHLGPHFTVIVNKSTVPIGSGNWVEAIIHAAFEASHDGKAEAQFSVASNPEFLREGSAVADSLYPDRIVVGTEDPRTLEVLQRLYRPLIDQDFPAPAFCPRPPEVAAIPFVSTDLASAELIKYAANAFLALKVSFINEIGLLAHRVGADVREVARGIGLDARIGQRYLQAGLGWGGSCFGKDTAALISTAAEYGLSLPIIKAAREVNQRLREGVPKKLLDELKGLKGKRVGLLGLAFKPNTDDLRDAPALDIARRLGLAGAHVVAHDPVAMPRFQCEQAGLPVTLLNSPEAVFEQADAVVLVTEWEAYQDLAWEAVRRLMRIPLLLDGRNVLDKDRLVAAGYRYLCMP